MAAGTDDRKAVGSRTIQYAATVLHHALKDAVRWGLTVRNAAEAADPPRPKRREMATWSPEQLSRFLAGTKDDRLHPLWVFLANTGVRRGEALGLRWRHLDLDRGRASIVASLIEVEPSEAHPDGYQLSEPKTSAGRRTIALDKETVRALRAHRKRQAAERLTVGEGWRGERRGEAYADLVFCTEVGEPLHPKTASAFASAVRRSGVPRLTLHGLRHSHASLGIEAGVHIKVISSRLGHSSIAVTADTYSHVSDALDLGAAETIAALLQDHVTGM